MQNEYLFISLQGKIIVKYSLENWSIGLDTEAVRFSLRFVPSYRDLDTVDSMPFVYCYSLIDLILYSFIQLTFTENIACA